MPRCLRKSASGCNKLNNLELLSKSHNQHLLPSRHGKQLRIGSQALLLSSLQHRSPHLRRRLNHHERQARHSLLCDKLSPTMVRTPSRRASVLRLKLLRKYPVQHHLSVLVRTKEACQSQRIPYLHHDLCAIFLCHSTRPLLRVRTSV
jgi:hypothetical protein